MRYQVPQNIDMEDKIVGPLTLPQFLYLMFGGIVVYLAYQSLYFNARFIFFLLAIPTSLLSLSLAFLKVQEEPFPKFLASLMLYLVRPKQRVWFKGIGEQMVIKKSPPKAKITATPHQTFSTEELDTVTAVLDTGGKIKKRAINVPLPPLPPKD